MLGGTRTLRPDRRRADDKRFVVVAADCLEAEHFAPALEVHLRPNRRPASKAALPPAHISAKDPAWMPQTALVVSITAVGHDCKVWGSHLELVTILEDGWTPAFYHGSVQRHWRVSDRSKPSLRIQSNAIDAAPLAGRWFSDVPARLAGGCERTQTGSGRGKGGARSPALAHLLVFEVNLCTPARHLLAVDLDVACLRPANRAATLQAASPRRWL